MRPAVHFRLGGERPACKPKDWTGFGRPNLTENVEAVDCVKCLAVMRRVVERLKLAGRKRRAR